MTIASPDAFEVLKQPSAMPVTNFIGNSEFGVDTSGWTALNSSVLTRVTSDYNVPPASMQIAPGGTGSLSVASYLYTPGGVLPVITFYFTVRVKGTNGASRAALLSVSEEGGASGTQTTNGSAVVFTGLWQTLVVSRTIARSDRTSLRFLILGQSVVAADIFLVDSAIAFDSTIFSYAGIGGPPSYDFFAGASTSIVVPRGHPSPVL